MTSIIQQSIVSSQFIRMNECKFFHYIPDDNNYYHVTCQIIQDSDSILDNNDYEHGFFYYGSTINYFVKCQLFSHPLIINILNKEIYGMDINMNNFEREKSLSLKQKLNLERDLKQILPFYFMQNHFPKREMKIDPNININPLHGQGTEQMISINGNQNNFGNENGFYQNNKVVDYTCSVTQPTNFNTFHRNNNVNGIGSYIHNVHSQKQIGSNNISPTGKERSPLYNNRNTNSSNNNIDDNLTTSVVYNQKNCLPRQNRVEDIQQADLNNYPLCQIPEREMISDYNRNTNLLQNNVVTHDVTIPDINFDRRDFRNTFPQQHGDIYIPAERITTQDVLTADVNQNYDNGMLYNDNHNTQ
jgi:hypothetical protein